METMVLPTNYGGAAAIGYAVGDYKTTAKDSGGTISASELNRVITIDSAGAQILNLPAATAARVGKWLEFRKLGAGSVTVNANGTDIVVNSAAGGNIVNSVAAETYAFVILKIDKTGHWGMSGVLGSWTTT